MSKQNSRKSNRNRLVLALVHGAVGINFYVRPKVSRQSDGSILIESVRVQDPAENVQALKGFARLYVTGPKATDDDVSSMPWYNVQRGIGQALTGYFKNVSGPPGFDPFAAYALEREDGTKEAYVVVRNIKGGRTPAYYKRRIDEAMKEIDSLFQSGKVHVVQTRD